MQPDLGYNPFNDTMPTKEEWEAHPHFGDMSHEEQNQFVAAAMRSIHFKMPLDVYPVFLLVARGGSNVTNYAHIKSLRPSIILALENALANLRREQREQAKEDPERN